MDFRVLGPLRVCRDGEPLDLGGTKQRALLALLLLGRGTTVSRDQLIDALWGMQPPPTVDRTLRAYVSRLRRVLGSEDSGPRVARESRGYRLVLEPGELDLVAFEALVDDGRRAMDAEDPTTAQTRLAAAHDLVVGTPLSDLLELPSLRSESTRLTEACNRALELLVEADLALGRAGDHVAALSALVEHEPFREHAWGLLMRVHYQSGQQRDALAAFDHVRRLLREELGVDPGAELRDLQHRVLVQDASLDQVPTRPTKPAVAVDGRTTAALPGRRRSARQLMAITMVAGVVAALAGVIVLAPSDSDPGTAKRPPAAHQSIRRDPTGAAGTTILDLRTGDTTAFISKDVLDEAAYPVYADGHFWVNVWSPSGYVEIDPDTGDLLRRLDPPALETTNRQESSTVTPFTVSGDTLWATTGDDLVQISITLGRETDRFRLDELGHGSGLAEGVAIGGHSVWVSRDVAGGQVLRLDPRTGRVRHVFSRIAPHFNLAFGHGVLWAADTRGLVRIDSRDNTQVTVAGVRGNCGGGVGGCVAAAGGHGWTSRAADGVVYRVDPRGHVDGHLRTEVGAGFLAHSAGALWAGNFNEGTVAGYDMVSGRQVAHLDFEHPVEEVSAGGHYLLVATSPQESLRHIISSLGPRVAVFAAHPGQLGDGDEPALDVDLGAYQIENATCAPLLRTEADRHGRTVVRPVVANGPPTLSRNRRTYTFHIRSGFAFAPPSGQPVTARTYQYSIQRALSPRLTGNPTGQGPPGRRLINDIVGERAFQEGTQPSISGIRARADALSITLDSPSQSFLRRLAAPYFCPVPLGTPYIAGAPHLPSPTGAGPILSAGPYYVSQAANGNYVVLQPNPSYPGPARPLDAIVIREDLGPRAAVELTLAGELDGITAMRVPPRRSWPASDGRLETVRTRVAGRVVTELVGPRVGCRRTSHSAYGLDLASICLEPRRSG